MCAATKVLNIKRKHITDNVPSSRPTKVSKVADGPSKQAACGKVAVKKMKSTKSRALKTYPRSDGCARSSVNGWEWHRWSLSASPAERARVRGVPFNHSKYVGSEINASQWSNVKGLSARTNRVKLRSLLAAVEGADLLKATQLKVIGDLIVLEFILLLSISNIKYPLLLCRQGRSAYVSNGAIYMIGALLPWSQLRQMTLSLNMLES